ncbi:nocobactin polyketide synthase NbtC [Mycobacterium simiae]|nr:nocobactin polyketide synthase NbtC [Mycobacterium simiae]
MIASYRLPNGTMPVLLSADTPNLLHGEAAALLCYLATHPGVAPDRIAAMLFRTRIARRHRALAMVTDRDELVGALQAIIDNREHHSLVRATTPATGRRLAYVFPGQGGQRPGMARLFYEAIPAFRAEVDRCAETFQAQFGESPLDYLLTEHFPAEDSARTVQPALFTNMAGLAAAWRSFGIAPSITVGHSQGEIAAAYVSGAVTLPDAVRVVGIRARAVDEFASGAYAMAVVAAGRDTCEDLLARRSGWAQLSVVNSPSMVGISGERETVQGIVDTLTEQGTFARVIAVRYPAHTSAINELATLVRAPMQHQLQNSTFLDTDIDCLGATLGGALTPELPVDEYWFWNLRNTVRFDKAVAAAVQRGVDTFVELAEHPTLALAIQENLAGLADLGPTMVVGTSERTATDLNAFTINLAQLAVHDQDYSWESLRIESDGPAPLPLLDFPNTRMSETQLWLPYDEVLPRRGRQTSAVAAVAPVAESAPDPIAETTPARLMVEKWIRLSQHSLVAPRAIGIVDHTGACAELVDAVCAEAVEMGAKTRLIDAESDSASSDFNTMAILVPQSPKLDHAAAAAEVAAFFSDRRWWPGVADSATDYWLVTVGGEAVLADDVAPDPVHAAVSAGFRSIGAEYPGLRFRHVDLPGEATTSDAARAVLLALHTAEEPELAFRRGGLYAKRIAASERPVADPAGAAPEHVLIIGGTGHLGLEFCEHFARRGARRITLVSRSGETAAVAERVQQIRSATATLIRVAQCDVSIQADVSRLSAEHQEVPADLIIHAAVDYSSIGFNDITAAKVDQALRAKVVGIGRVLETFPRTDNCRVVLCSSARATIGGRGQVVYAAANRMLDAMAHQLRSEGLDCVSLQWGQWTVHFDLDAASMVQLAAIGVVPMAPADAIALGMNWIGGNAIIAAFDFDRARPALEAFGYGPLIAQLTAPVVAASILETPAAVATTGLPQRLLKVWADAIGVDRAETVDTTIPMVAIGLDSLQALEFRRQVKAEFNHELDVAQLLGGASLADVLQQLGA